MDAFSFGPFSYTPGAHLRVAGNPMQRWTMHFGQSAVAERMASEAAARSDVIDAFADDRGAFEKNARDTHWPARISLIDYASGDEIAHFLSFDSCGMTPGLIDDRSNYWIRSDDKLRSRSVTLTDFAALAAAHAAPLKSWIAGLLPDDVLTLDPSAWRPPSSWEIRHVVGEGSFTGITGAAAAELVGVTPQNFRKYTAADGARTRQQISYAMWHLLLSRLGVQRA